MNLNYQISFSPIYGPWLWAKGDFNEEEFAKAAIEYLDIIHVKPKEPIVPQKVYKAIWRSVFKNGEAFYKECTELKKGSFMITKVKVR